MDVGCEQVRERARTGELDAPDVVAHAAQCPACSVLLADRGRLARWISAAEDGPREAERSAPSVGSPGRALGELSTRTRLGLALGVAAVLPALVLAATPRPDLALVSASYLLAAGMVLAGAAVASTSVALRPLWRPMRASRAWAVLALSLAGLTGVCLVSAGSAHPASLGGVGAELVPRAAACFAFGSVWALGLLGAAAVVFRRGSLPPAGIGLALAAAAVGNLALELHCSIDAIAHRVLGHWTVALVFVLVALLVGVCRRPGR